ncbi:MAG: hypothetical protein ABIT38_21685, partial [Gemmatimonadaceae bacterium]
SSGSDGARLGASRPLPWSGVTPLVAPFFAVVMAVASIREGREKETSFEFSQRLEKLRAHSHRFERYRERHDSPRPETAVPNEK